MKIDQFVAREMAAKIISRYQEEIGLPLVIMDGSTEEVASGWVFFYNTSAFAEGGDEFSALVGNAPIFIDREGRMQEIPTSVPWDAWLSENGLL